MKAVGKAGTVSGANSAGNMCEGNRPLIFYKENQGVMFLCTGLWFILCSSRGKVHKNIPLASPFGMG